MRRVRSSALLSDDDGRLRFLGEPFSGLAYDLAEDGLLRVINKVEVGRNVGRSDDWLGLPADGKRVDGGLLFQEEDYGPQLFDGVPFTGLAYYFEPSGACVAEVEFVDGYATDELRREWYEGGEPKELMNSEEYAAWFRDGRLKSKATDDGILYSLIFEDDDDEQDLGGIVLRDAGLFDLESIREMAFSEDFHLIGGAVDTDLLRTLREQTPFSATKALRLVETAIGIEGTDVLASLESLEKLALEDNPGLGADEVRLIERRLPGCSVQLEDTSV